MRYLLHEEWKARAVKRFGPDPRKWRFKCPSCGYVASVEDWLDAKAPESAIATTCIGVFTGSTKGIYDKTGGPCTYLGGGLIGLNPVTVVVDGKDRHVFEFADD